MPKRTLLLVFIHGFKGGDDTFARFPPHLKAILGHALPHLNIISIVYPRFETRGELHDAVANFKEWLQNKVIDLEVAAGTPSPTIDPSVRTILIGHSMGGIVAAETILSITRDQPIKSPSASTLENDPLDVPFMFPSILGLLAFDTPYLGISPGVVAHNVETHYQNIRGAWSAYNAVQNVFGGAAASSSGATRDPPKPHVPSNNDPDVAVMPAWQKWGKYAMFAGAAGAVLATGAAAYANRTQISEGWGWATSHLEFVGCLVRGVELENRIASIAELSDTRNLGFRNLFTLLGRSAGDLTWQDKSAESGGSGASNGVKVTYDEFAHEVKSGERTFCLLPKTSARRWFEPTVNDKATSEITAHMNMFTPKENPGYYNMSERAKAIIVEYVKNGWAVIEGEEQVAENDLTKEPEIVDTADTTEEPEIVDKCEVEMDIENIESNPWK